MSVRITASVFIAALVRRVQSDGGFAYVARRGNDQAGAIFIAFAQADTGEYVVYAPAPPSQNAENDAPLGGRSFVEARRLESSIALSEFVDREARFDPDFWLLEIENWRADPADLITITP